jgi:hypothetical protein
VQIRFLAIVAVVAILASGCTSGESSPRPSSSASPSGPSTALTSPSPSRTGPLTTGPNVRPGEKPPTLPAAAKQHTPAGALAFAEYYFQAFDWGYATSDPFLVQEISGPKCTACQRYVNGLETLTQSAGYVRGGRVSLESAKLVTGSFRVKSDYVVELVNREQAVVLVKPGVTPTTAQAAVRDDTSLVFASWVAGRWQVDEVGAPS